MSLSEDIQTLFGVSNKEPDALDRSRWHYIGLINGLLVEPPIISKIASPEDAREILEMGVIGLLQNINKNVDLQSRRAVYEDLALIIEAITSLSPVSAKSSGSATPRSVALVRTRRAHLVLLLRTMYEEDPVKNGLMTNYHLLKLVLKKLPVGKRTLERARTEAWPT